MRDPRPHLYLANFCIKVLIEQYFEYMRLWDGAHSHVLQLLNGMVFLPSKHSSGKAAFWVYDNNLLGRKGIKEHICI